MRLLQRTMPQRALLTLTRNLIALSLYATRTSAPNNNDFVNNPYTPESVSAVAKSVITSYIKYINANACVGTLLDTLRTGSLTRYLLGFLGVFGLFVDGHCG